MIPAKRGFVAWLRERRNSARDWREYSGAGAPGFSSSFMGLIWTPSAGGRHGERELTISVYLAFQKVITLGGLGDLGMERGGGHSCRSISWGKGKREELRKFLASARTVFLSLAFLVGGGFLFLAPWLPQWLHFKAVPGAGSLRLLFALGAFLITGVLLASYLNSLNYACGNVAWPIIPAFLVLQLAMLGTWLLARQQQPLWIQYLPSVAAAVAGMCLIRFYIRSSDPSLALHFFPIGLDCEAPRYRCSRVSFWTYSLRNAGEMPSIGRRTVW